MNTRPIALLTPPPPSLAEQVADIAAKQAKLEEKLDLILALLQTPPS